MGEQWVPNGSEARITCLGCPKQAMVLAYNLFGSNVYPYLPPYWLFTDSYPTGDDGVHFWCSVQCMVENGARVKWP